jgi:formate/nitrite transporter FocA (FNT family)
MYFISAGLVAKQQPEFVQLLSTISLDNLNITHFLWNNLLPVTLGNIIGGSVFVGLFYWFIYIRK